ncbi:hypothetical protein FB45DRAFT_820738 [Roridomyces roridus]|uniref:MYND-type domain-containing protein n=1 Tax=Roridomyces roridus TaxID=1738132 RepID=A0AAD7CKR2_9AGAR|nr:hypothetical protein FB45DRAFT_820738 [Roridomyces roridus]
MSRNFWAIAPTVTAVITTAVALYLALDDPSPVLETAPPIERMRTESPTTETVETEPAQWVRPSRIGHSRTLVCDGCGRDIPDLLACECSRCAGIYCTPICHHKSVNIYDLCDAKTWPHSVPTGSEPPEVPPSEKLEKRGGWEQNISRDASLLGQDPLRDLQSTCDWCETQLSDALTYRCSGCTAKYCSQSCLQQSAEDHAGYCAKPTPRPPTTADKLLLAVFNDSFPDDEQTNEDYFFTRLDHPQDKTMLLGLYIGIVQYHGVSAGNLHDWRIAGTMVENIKALYERLPAQGRGGYYSWFLKHLDIFEPRTKSLVPLSVQARHLCAFCGVSAGVRCSGCKKVWYCDRMCQKDDWSSHLVNCYQAVGRPVTSADHLRAAIHRRRLPDDLEILSDYGFTRVNEEGQVQLQGIYYIVFDEGVRPRELLRWQRTGNLYEELETFFNRLENWETYPIITWFRANRYAFDLTMPVPEHATSGLAEVTQAAIALWKRVGDFPSQDLDEIFGYIADQWPEEKAAVFRFLSVEMCYPLRPGITDWVHFGFCACHDQYEEMFLAQTYRMLSQRCSFDDFVTAYGTSKLAELFDTCELHGRRIVHPYLEDVLSGSPSALKSVRELKRHVLDVDATRADLNPSVLVDYGFIHCASESEYHDLRDLYRNIFQRRGANPLMLHEACIARKLYEFVLELFPELAKKKNRAKKFQRLLRNVYQLTEPQEISGIIVG